MLKVISSSDLRAQIKRVLNEVGYGQSQYVVEKFGEPTARHRQHVGLSSPAGCPATTGCRLAPADRRRCPRPEPWAGP